MIRKRRKPVAPILELTPLVDVVFLLLTFYMLTSSFVREDGISLELPSAEAAAPRPVKSLSISLVDESRVQIDGQIVLLSELTALLLPRVEPNTIVVVRAEKTGSVQTLVSVLDSVKAADVRNITLATTDN